VRTLVVDNIKKKYGKKIAVDGISFSLNKGDLIGLIGENGAGKSTTMSMIATLIKPNSGDILLDGESIIKNPKCIKKCLGYVPQDIALYANMSGYDNLKFWGKMYHLNKSQLNMGISKVKDIIGLSDKILKDRVCNYSGGMKRRVNIGAALLHDPSIVIMDEPTVGIDINSRKQILQSVEELTKDGKTIIYTGHYLEEIEKLCNKICLIDRGKVKQLGETSKLLIDENGERINLEKLYQQNVG